jgi:hypothetical protein
MAVEERRESAQSELRRQRRDDAAADAALGGHADAIDPFAGVIIHARTRHHRKRAGNDVRRDHLNSGDRIDAAVSQCRRHDREIARGDQHGALPKIRIEHGVNVALQYRVIAQQPGDRSIAVAGGDLRGVHGIIDAEFAASKLTELLPDAFECVSAIDLMDQSRARDRAGIDHRIERPVVVGEPDRVESLAAGLNADRGGDALLPDRLERKGKHEGLGDRLNGERHGAVAGFIDVAIDGDERDPELGRIGSLQLRDVVGNRTGIICFELLVAAGQKSLQRGLCGVSGISRLDGAADLKRYLGVHEFILIS